VLIDDEGARAEHFDCGVVAMLTIVFGIA